MFLSPSGPAEDLAFVGARRLRGPLVAAVAAVADAVVDAAGGQLTRHVAQVGAVETAGAAGGGARLVAAVLAIAVVVIDLIPGDSSRAVQAAEVSGGGGGAGAWRWRAVKGG